MKLVCIGDSLTFGFKMTRKNSWPQIVGKGLEIEVENKGVCGDTTGGMLSRFGHDVVMEKPEYVLIMGGSNDLIFQLPESVIHSNLAAIAYQACHYRIQPIIGIPIPITSSAAGQDFNLVGNIEEINKKILSLRDWILDFSSEEQIKAVDFFKEFYDPVSKKGKKDLYIDDIHPTKEGNIKMAQKVIEIMGKHIHKAGGAHGLYRRDSRKNI